MPATPAPTPAPTPESPSTFTKRPLAGSSQKPGLAPLKVDVGRKPAHSETPNSSFSAASPITSPISPPTTDAGYSRFTVLRPKRSNNQLPTTGRSASGGAVDQSEESGDDMQALGSSARNGPFPVFAAAAEEMEYEYHSDDPSVEDTFLDTPSDTQHSPSATEPSTSFATVQTAFNPFGAKKSSSRVTFQASLGAQAQR